MSIHENARQRKSQQDAHKSSTEDTDQKFIEALKGAIVDDDDGRTIRLDIAFVFAALARLPLSDRGVVITEVMRAAENADNLSGAERALLALFIHRPGADAAASEVDHAN